MQAYIREESMDLQGWGGSTELYAFSHLLKKRIFTYTALTDTWESHCPSRVDQSIIPPCNEQALYVYHTGDHYNYGGDLTVKVVFQNVSIVCHNTLTHCFVFIYICEFQQSVY